MQNRWGEALKELTPDELIDAAMIFFHGDNSEEAREIKVKKLRKERAELEKEILDSQAALEKKIKSLASDDDSTSEYTDDDEAIINDMTERIKSLEAALAAKDGDIEELSRLSGKLKRFDRFVNDVKIGMQREDTRELGIKKWIRRTGVADRAKLIEKLNGDPKDSEIRDFYTRLARFKTDEEDVRMIQIRLKDELKVLR